ncbi:uncharacterized protein LOC105699944 isoform X2 [Orussus abietinus]|uniref:uncharacterized protein LOC105699944 isoform X2 n=1 Tax=Orussus abietinus TaxID=222816 RepID=UPI000C715D97|nr:uncharacterized protein LOC105699944 isoform X2 [Orussus abietinus]
MTVGGTTLVHCGSGGEDRPAHLAIPSNALAPSLNAALNSTLNSTLGGIGNIGATTAAAAAAAWPPTLWQYPTAAMPMEPVGFPQMGVGLQGGLQLVRDPSTGHLLLIHAAEQMQQAVVWPNYPNHGSNNVGPPPPLLLPPPPPPSLQLLSDIGGARLVLTENKRKQQSSLPIVKIEADCGSSPTTIITSTESTKALQTVTSVTGTLIPDTPLVTTLHYYPHAPALVQISQAEPAHCKTQPNAFLSKATSPVSCLTPPPEVTTIHAIEPADSIPIGVQDASNQTDAPETDEEHGIIEPYVKQEQNPSPCQMQGASTPSYDMVSSSDRICSVRIGGTGSQRGSIITKVDKAENTVVNMSDRSKHGPTQSPIKDCRNSVDRTIEHVVNYCQEEPDEDEEKVSVEQEQRPILRDARMGPKIIEITEENCDSFHENLEFFTRRRDPHDYYLGKPEDLTRCSEEKWYRDKEEAEVKITEEPKLVETLDGNSKITSLEPNFQDAESSGLETGGLHCGVVKSVTSAGVSSLPGAPNCESCGKNRESWPPQGGETQIQLTVKSFDMPSIDEEHDVEQVVVKQEKDEIRFTDCAYASKSPAIPVERPKCLESFKRHSGEKLHPGIENVVEKLKKKNAAMQDSHKAEEAKERLGNPPETLLRPVESTHRRLENGLKKLILRSCENAEALEKLKSAEEKCPGDQVPDRFVLSDKYSQRTEVDRKSPGMNLPTHEFFLNNNNESSNNNIINNNNNEEMKIPKQERIGQDGYCELFEKEEPSDRKFDSMTPMKSVDPGFGSAGPDSSSVTISPSTEASDLSSPGVEEKRPRLTGKQKLSVDLSGLELLSNSIEQFEHLKPEIQNGLTADPDKSPNRSKALVPSGESNNNVDSPLGLLCALAEQRFMEEVAVDVPKRTTNLESSEEISRAGRLLLNLGKSSVLGRSRVEKRKHSCDGYEHSKRACEDRFKRASLEEEPHYFEDIKKSRKGGEILFRMKEKTRRNIDFTESTDKVPSNGENPARKDGEEGSKYPYDESHGKEESKITVDDAGYERTKLLKEYNKKYKYFRGVKKPYGEVQQECDFSDPEIVDLSGERKKFCSPLAGTLGPENFEDKVPPLEDHHESPESQLHTYGSIRGKLEAKKFIAKKGLLENDGDWPNMDAMELDMRVRLADIQRQYKEKQKELSKLTPKKEEKKSPGRPRKKSHSSSSESGILASPPMLDSASSPCKSPIMAIDEPTPPLTSVLAMPRCNVNLIKLGEPRSHIKLLDSIPSIPIPVQPVASPITVLPVNKVQQEEEEKNNARLNYETSSPAPTIASTSSASKKRKVGRPRKIMCSSGSTRHFTETIVAKKPKSKSSLVGYLMNSKNRHHLQNKFVSKSGYTPLPFKSSLSCSKISSKSHKVSKPKTKPVKQTPLHSKTVISSIIAEKAKLSQDSKLEKQTSKIKPKLKAEAKVKTWEDEESGDWASVADSTVPETILPESPKEIYVDPPEKEEIQVEEKEERPEKTKKKRKSTSSSPKRHKSTEREAKESKRRKSSECKECAKAAKAERAESIINRCKLTSAHLAIDQLRVLTAMGGLFYAGRLSAVQAPDVYAITLDGERGNRPHIHSREEILRDAIVEVCPSSTKELPPGTRLCAYWSQQYRCLYPGTSVEPTEPDPELDEKFVSVEFDDGDSGRIALDDIRLLQPDYPVVEYDPNPLLSLGKRRRQASMSTEDKRSSTTTQLSVPTLSSSSTVPTTSVTGSDAKSPEKQKVDEIDAKALEDYRERKRMKKRKRDKLKRLQEAQEGKKKHRRHKCCEEHRKHKHRKHRKHKHKHGHHSSHSETSHQSGGESCSGQKSEEEPAKDISLKTDEDKEPIDEKLVENETTEEPVTEPVQEVVTEEKVEKPKKSDKKAKSRERQESVESRSKMAAFLPARQLWGWAGKGYRRPGAKGRAKKQFFRAIQRGSETIQIGDSAVFLSTGRPDRPYIGRIESMWETSSSNMIVKVKWFYHPEETVGCPTNLKYPGALFESPHMDENDVQTISHKCEVLPLEAYTEKLGKEPHRYLTIYDNNDIYYLAGYYDPTTYLLTMQPGVV